MKDTKLWWFLEGEGTAEIRQLTTNEANELWDKQRLRHMSAGYQSKDELILGNEIQPNPCKECGLIYGVNYSEPTRSRLIETGICFGCDFWTHYVAKKDNPRAVRVEHKHYWAEDMVDKKTYRGSLGYGGADWRIRFHDGRIVDTNNLWHQGDIPKHFWDRLPDNAEFLTPNKTRSHDLDSPGYSHAAGYED